MSVNRVKNLGLPLMNLVKLRGTPILQQLLLEERLLRSSSDNWCIVNDGTNLLTLSWVCLGTVIVDENTLFVSLICNRNDVPDVQPYPRSVMAWSGSLYSEVFNGIADFQLRENDYVFGDRKFGGNAQSITRNRWIHHTSFLWDYSVSNMAYLKLPSRVPQYRLERDHTDFVCKMKDYIERSVFIEKTIKAVGTQFMLKELSLDEIDDSCREHVETTRLLTLDELKETTTRSESIAQAV
ncbi:hypothetical protein Bca52824_027358 [Brassica carinata]|uniref:BPL/LPL catalytic domain-containing protein n=1 Tax=Brassica carinata TaxID=52824 RepID=A0A8X7SJB5_BRACI|nr:hypothetical protein Bca52824_027358 [Brassica carinata]